MTFDLTKMHSWTKNNLEFSIFLSLPIFFILGNFFLNLSISIICLLFLIKIYNIKIIYREEKKIILSIFIFITSLIISFIFSEYNNINSFVKVLTYFRFIFLAFALSFILKFTNKKLKISFWFYLAVILFTCLDTVFQYFNGVDFFGHKTSDYYRLSGPFAEDELIVGNYILIFGFFLLSLLLKSYNVKKYLIFLFIIFFSQVILITGERNAFVGSLFVLIFIFLLHKKTRIFSFISLIVILLLFSFTLSLDKTLKNKYSNFYKIIYKIYPIKKNIEINKNVRQEEKIKSSIAFNWGAHYKIAIDIFNDNKFFGSGFKSFRYSCKKYENPPDKFCSTHPHNLYFELLSDLGLVGFFSFFFIIFFTLYSIINRRHLFKDLSYVILFSLFMLSIFPFKVHGSLFSTTTAFYFWFIFSNLIFFEKIYEKIKIN